jgi:hypothetical protein
MVVAVMNVCERLSLAGEENNGWWSLRTIFAPNEKVIRNKIKLKKRLQNLH